MTEFSIIIYGFSSSGIQEVISVVLNYLYKWLELPYL